MDRSRGCKLSREASRTSPKPIGRFCDARDTEPPQAGLQPGYLQKALADIAPVLSLVIPIFNEEAIIPELDRRLRAFLAGVGSGVGESWEVVFVNDGSKDRSLELLRELARASRATRSLSLSRNFGHQLAITAGLDRAERRRGRGHGRRPAGPARGRARR